MVALTVIAVLWLSSAIMIYGACFAYFQREYKILADCDYSKDRSVSIFLGLLGLIGGPVTLAVGYIQFDRFKHGFKFK